MSLSRCIPESLADIVKPNLSKLLGWLFFRFTAFFSAIVGNRLENKNRHPIEFRETN